MKIFKLVDSEIKIDEEVLTIPEFHTIWKQDKTKAKEKAFQILTYVYHMCDPASPYSNFPRDKRRESVQADLIGEKDWKETKEIKNAIEKYNQLSTTPLQRLLSVAQNKVDEIAKYLEDAPVDDDTIKPILEVFNKLTATVTNFGKLNEAVAKEQKQNSTKRRGEKSTALFED